MSLIDEMMEKFCFVDKIKTPDGAGGAVNVWTDGMEFDAVLTTDTTMQARLAEKQGVSSIYTVTTRKNNTLEYHDIIRRKSDRKIFRITSDGNDKKSPNVSTLDMSQATAERYELT